MKQKSQKKKTNGITGKAHQQEVIDLEKAGLNPVLSAGGSGAIGGSISPQMPDISGIKNAGDAIWQAISAKNLTLSTMADVKVKDEQAKNIATETILKSKQKGLIDAETAKKLIETEIAKKENKWYNWKSGVGIGRDAAIGIGSLLHGANIVTGKQIGRAHV